MEEKMCLSTKSALTIAVVCFVLALGLYDMVVDAEVMQVPEKTAMTEIGR